ncbi:ubiquitin-related domain-containing protein [Usnea florida]
MPTSRSHSRSPSPYSRRMAYSNHREDRPRSRTPPRRSANSPSPPRRDRLRSRSPRRRQDERPKKSGGGFKWKEKPRNDDEDRDRRDDRRLERGYREQGRERERERERERPRQRSPDRRDGGRKNERDNDVESKFGRGRDIAEKFGTPDSKADKKDGDSHPDKSKKEKKPASAATGEPMIVVNVNDRLGTKASIPCMASDPIRLFKAVVAARIGRQPHEIMLKRQGERPFKDQLTLEDYGVSNGVQLDL